MCKLLLIFLLIITCAELSAQPPMRKLLGKRVISSLPLDVYSGATRAYSLRKLRSAYAGSAIRVRRSSDNTEQDIGFLASGHLDTTALKTFVGANNGFIRWWYDQSTTANNAGQINAPQQPRIMNAGVIDRENGFPAMVLIPASNTLLSFPITTSLANWSTHVVGKRRVAGVRGPFVSVSGFSGGPLVAQWSDNNIYVQRTQSSGVGFYRTATTTDATANFILLEGYNSSNVTTAYRSGGAYTLGSEIGAGFTGLGFSCIGRYLESGSNFSDGTICEAIIYETDQISNRAGIEANLMTYYGL